MVNIEEFNEELKKLYDSYNPSEVSHKNLNFHEYCDLYYKKIQCENILRSGD